MALALAGGYRLFGKVMAVSIGVMFLTVVVTAVMLRPDWGAVLRGIFVPGIPDLGGNGIILPGNTVFTPELILFPETVIVEPFNTTAFEDTPSGRRIQRA